MNLIDPFLFLGQIFLIYYSPIHFTLMVGIQSCRLSVKNSSIFIKKLHTRKIDTIPTNIKLSQFSSI